MDVTFGLIVQSNTVVQSINRTLCCDKEPLQRTLEYCCINIVCLASVYHKTKQFSKMFDEVKNETLISRSKIIVKKCTLRFVVLRVFKKNFFKSVIKVFEIGF